MNANKAKPMNFHPALIGTVAAIAIYTVLYFTGCEEGRLNTPAQTEKPTTNPPAIDSVTIDKLKACLKLTTTIPVQEHDIIVIPFVGETVGFTAMHSPACKHKSH